MAEPFTATLTARVKVGLRPTEAIVAQALDGHSEARVALARLAESDAVEVVREALAKAGEVLEVTVDVVEEVERP